MPYLDWAAQLQVLSESDSPLKDSGSHDGSAPSSKKLLTLDLSRLADSDVLLQSLEDLMGRPHSELRLSLPKNWTVFWKLRHEGESRLLAAHPEENTWVGTVSFASELMERVIHFLKTRESEALLLSELGVMSSISNFDLKLRLK